jgi:PEP-CTERM motif
MRARWNLWLLIALSSAVFFPSAARADTIRIASGFLNVGGDDAAGRGGLIGDRRGFSVEIFAPAPAWHFVFCSETAGCAPLTTVTVTHSWVGLDFPARNATLDGIRYEEVNSLTGDAWVSTAFNSSLTLPPLSSSAVLRTRFTMTGLFSIVPDEGERRDFPLAGSGTLTSTWRGDFPGDPGVWHPVLLRYDFAPTPVPEPATIVLVGIAGAAAAFSRRRRRIR